MLPKLAVAVALDLRPFLLFIRTCFYAMEEMACGLDKVYTHSAVEICTTLIPLSDALVETPSGAVVDASRRCGSRAIETVAATKRHATENRILQYVHCARTKKRRH